MPQLYRRPVNQADGVYHVFNRGVNKSVIFRNAADYAVYIQYLKEYLQPKLDSIREICSKDLPGQIVTQKIAKLNRIKNFSENIDLLAYCLMPNHVHLLVRQNSASDVASFLHSLHTRYVMYFNLKYKRQGVLFESKYKSKLVTTDKYLVYVSKYIHANPSELCKRLENYLWSSMSFYDNERHPIWLHTDLVVKKFIISPYAKTFKSYSDYVRDRP